MRIVLAAGTILLFILAALHAVLPKAYLLAGLYAGGGFLALFCLKQDLNLAVSKVFALAAMVLMFFYFATFFRMIGELSSTWYLGALAFEAASLLISAFTMIVILSVYSCRLKAVCTGCDASHRALFSAPEVRESE